MVYQPALPTRITSTLNFTSNTRKMVCFRVNCTSSVRIFTVSSSSSSLDEVQIVRASIYRLLKNEKPQNSDLKLRCTSWSKNLSRLTVAKPRSFKIALGLCSCNEGSCNPSRKSMCVCVIVYYSKFMKNNHIQYKSKWKLRFTSSSPSLTQCLHGAMLHTNIARREKAKL